MKCHSYQTSKLPKMVIAHVLNDYEKLQLVDHELGCFAHCTLRAMQ